MPPIRFPLLTYTLHPPQVLLTVPNTHVKTRTLRHTRKDTITPQKGNALVQVERCKRQDASGADRVLPGIHYFTLTARAKVTGQREIVECGKIESFTTD